MDLRGGRKIGISMGKLQTSPQYPQWFWPIEILIIHLAYTRSIGLTQNPKQLNFNGEKAVSHGWNWEIGFDSFLDQRTFKTSFATSKEGVLNTMWEWEVLSACHVEVILLRKGEIIKKIYWEWRRDGEKGMEKEELHARSGKRGTTVKRSWVPFLGIGLGYQCLLYRMFLYFMLNAKWIIYATVITTTVT